MSRNIKKAISTSFMPQLYEPQEDSFMLAEQVRNYARGIVLDIGTGTGIQVLSALKNKNVKKVIGVDISKTAIDYCRENIKNKKAEFYVSDLFEFLKRKNSSSGNFFSSKFDTIIFNPPYLPSQLKLKDLTIEGGKKGYETIERFLNQVNNFLTPKGIILLLFSSQTKKEMVDKLITNNLLEYEILATKHIFFEDLYVYKIKKSEILKQLEKKGIGKINFYAKGRHGLIYRGTYNRKKVIIKIKNPKSKAIDTIKKEIKWLKLLNKHKISPKFIFGSDDFAVYEFIGGEFILDYIKNNSSEKVNKVLKEILKQMYLLDKLHITKEEMHMPFKHIIVRKHKPVLIDFERAHFTKKPKNFTQFCGFLIRNLKLLEEKGIRLDRESLIRFAKKYRKSGGKTEIYI